MVFSFKANKGKVLAVVALVAIIVVGAIFLPSMTQSQAEHLGETHEQRVEFLESFGWDIADEELDSRDVTIPKEFSEVYLTYNEMQKSQGFDLVPYAGVMCKQYIYQILNYPMEGKQVNATLLVYEGLIIGGDVSCAEVDGFMHGFAADSAHYGQTVAEESSTVVETGGEVMD